MQLRCAALVGAVALAAAGPVHASFWIATGVQGPALHVNSAGNAGVTWTQHGAHLALIVPPTGRVYHAALAGPDVSKPTPAAGLPFAIAVRRTADGTHWALQLLPVTPGQPPELHFSSWHGAPTSLTLASDGQTLQGQASFHGRPITGFTVSPSGARLRIYVYLWCLGCSANPSGWTRLIGVAPKADGSFSVALRPEWQGTKYRATLAGPNLGRTRAPDALAFAGG